MSWLFRNLGDPASVMKYDQIARKQNLQKSQRMLPVLVSFIDQDGIICEQLLIPEFLV